MEKILVTGANGHLGRRLIATLPGHYAVAAVVRSERARRLLLRHIGARPHCTVTLADPGDEAAITAVAADCQRAVHLVGTIKATRDNPYVDSHQRPARALAAAAADAALKQVVYVSILGAGPDSGSQCLRARFAVEQILRSAGPALTVIRVPMVLGEADRASYALARRAMARRVTVFRAASREQPIYAGDVITALMNALQFAPAANAVFDLAGPESVSRRELIVRAAATVGRRPRIVSLPLWIGLAFAGGLELLSPKPPFTRDMLRILDHDDDIDPTAAAATLGLTLTSLDAMLKRCIPNRINQEAI